MLQMASMRREGDAPGALDRRPTVVFVHGLGQDERSNARLRRAVADAGYPVWATTYRPARRGIRALADELGERIEADLGPQRPLAAVAHSLGAILIRHLAQRFDWQRVLMLAPPNQGSRVAAKLRDQALYRWAYGAVGRELADGDAWPEPPKPFAVITGNRPLTLGNPTSWLSSAIGIFDRYVEHDGTIAVEETLLPGMRDFALVDASHTGILDHPFTAELALEFLEHGRFISRLPIDVPGVEECLERAREPVSKARDRRAA